MDETHEEPTLIRARERDGQTDLSQPVKLATGEMVAGRYKVLEEIGRGGMAVVYRVEQVFLREVFALKVLGTGLSDISTVRFQKEAQVCRLLEHPNLIRVFDFAVLEDNSPFLVMEFLQGQTLAQLIDSQGALSENFVLDIFVQVLDGLNYAHSQGIIHRDLKPSNIMLNCTAPGHFTVKIVDFGIAKMVEVDDLNSMSLTRTGEIFGSPLYMSPEQCLGKTVDSRSDLYSVGCAMYQALTGAPPFAGKTALSTMMLHQTQVPAPLQEASLGKSYSVAIEQVVLKLLAKSPDERYQTATEARNDLLLISGDHDLKLQQREKAVQRKKSSAPNMVLLLSCLCLFLVTLLTYALITLKQTKAIVRAGADDTKQELSLSAIPDKHYFARTPIDTAGSGPWVLAFPSEEVGKIGLSSDSDHAVPKMAAQGVVTFPKAAPLIFATDMRYGFTAEDFLRFRPDEIAELQLIDEFITDSALANVSSYTKMKILSLIWCRSLTDKCATSIVKLPSLKSLRVEGESISAAQIGRIAKDMKLPSVLTKNVSNPHDLLRELIGTKGLTCLFVEDNHWLKDADLADVGKLKELKVLSLDGCENVTDAGILKLTNLPDLQQIVLLNTRITAKSISALKKLPHHCWLRVGYGPWSYNDRVLYMKEFPHDSVP